MGYEKGEKLNRLQRLLPTGLVVTAAWLNEHGYSSALLGKYVANGWLEQPARGIYRRPAGELLWQHVVISLQTLLETPIFVGGRTALEQQGFSHYVSQSSPQEVHLYSSVLPPGWLRKVAPKENFVLHRTKRLFKNTKMLSSGKWDSEHQAFLETNMTIPDDLSLQSWGQWRWPLVMSKPERAVLELLDEVPKSESFHQADMLIEGLRTLSPRRLQVLLEECTSVKVKRLFLWFAERHQPPWLDELNLEHIDLGSGKRSLAPGGKLDRKYLITVPEDMHGDQYRK